MVQLIYQYILKPTPQNAERVRKYAHRHPFSLLMVPRDLVEQYGHLWREK